MTPPPSTAAPILAVLAIVLVTLGAYVGGYFWFGEYYGVALFTDVERIGPDHEFRRAYRYEWLARIYQPLASVETWYGGVIVETNSTP